MTFLTVLLLFNNYSCTDYDDYKQYIPNGEIVYTSKVDTIVTFPGKNRIQLQWIKNDLRINKYLISWNNGKDSLWVNTPSTHIPDTITTIIEDIEESDYEFSIVSYDLDNNKSIKSLFSGAVYGSNYEKTLLNRGIQDAKTFVNSNTTEITWYAPLNTNELGVEVIYTNTLGIEVTETFSPTDLFITLKDYKVNTLIKYRTIYSPAPNAIDRFYTDYTFYTPKIVYAELDKSKFKAVYLPSDVTSAWGWVMPNLWDNNLGTGFHTPDVGFPLTFTIDLGTDASLKSIIIWQRLDRDQVFQKGNMKKFEIWGSNNPASDGSFTDWTKLLTGTSIKPSAGNDITNEDIAYASAGEKYEFPEDIPNVRYIRFNVLEVWKKETPYTHIMELTLTGIY